MRLPRDSIRVLAVLLFAVLTAQPSLAACSDHPEPGVDWSGCSKNVAQIEKKEREQPALRKAATVAETGNSAEAISLFYKALEKNPRWH